MKAVVKEADNLRRQGKDVDADLLLTVLNRSASAAHELMVVPLESLTDEDRESIKAGKVAPRSFLPEEKEKKKPLVTPYRKAIKDASDLTNQVSLLEGSLARTKKDEHKQKVYEIIEKQIKRLQSLLPVPEPSDTPE